MAVQILTEIARYANVLLMLFFTLSGLFAVLNKHITRKGFGNSCANQRFVIIAFNVLNVAIVLLRAQESGDLLTAIRAFATAWIALIVLGVTMSRFHRGANKILTNCIIFLLSVGLVMQWRIKPEVCLRQVNWIVVGVVVMNVVMFILRGRWVYKIPWVVWGILAIGLVGLPFLFPSSANGSLNWVEIAGFSFQPSELIKPVLVFFLSTLFIRKHKISSIICAAAVVGILSLALLIQNDLGLILIFCSMLFLMVYDYTQKEWILIVGLVAVAIAGVLAYKLVGHVRTRVDIWIDPWSQIDGGGYQITQSLFAIAGGKFFGTGLFMGVPYNIPEGWTDMIFAGICEEYGAVFGSLLVTNYLLMALMMFNLVSRYENRLRRNIAMACSIITSIQTILIIGGVIKLIPLTGVTLPFVSYGGTSLISTFIVMSIVQELFRSRTQTEKKVRAYEDQQKLEAADDPYQETDWRETYRDAERRRRAKRG